ncbi:hypothetical protein ACIQV2_23345 [Streptomyces globosus]|uniref:hypothetical protein n=1 Tax=Streptomyces globosus TaxID=68209 RepID=UPI00382FF9A6
MTARKQLTALATTAVVAAGVLSTTPATAGGPAPAATGTTAPDTELSPDSTASDAVAAPSAPQAVGTDPRRTGPVGSPLTPAATGAAGAGASDAGAAPTSASLASAGSAASPSAPQALRATPRWTSPFGSSLRPAPPTGLSAAYDAASAKATLRWTAGKDADLAGHRLYRRVGDGPWTAVGGLAPLTATTFTDTPPATGDRVAYHVRAVSTTGRLSDPGTEAAVTTVDRATPPAPTALTSHVEAHQTHLYWEMPWSFTTDLANGGHFRVYRSPGRTLDPASLTPVTCVSLTIDGSDRLTGECTDQGMAAGTHHTYAVTAVNAAGRESALSAPLTVRSGDQVAPGPVSALTATPRNDGMVLRWAAPADDDIASYTGLRGERRADGTVHWLESCGDGPAEPLALLCPGSPEGDEYVYTVVAKDRWDNRLSPTDPMAPTVTARLSDLRPSVAFPLFGQAALGLTWSTEVLGEDRPHVSWTCRDTALCDRIADYRISRWNPAAGAYEPLHTGLLPAAARSHTDVTAAVGTTHHYAFEALRADGSTAVSHAWACVRPERL